MSPPRFFGYGSLVNLATHDYPDARPARLNGWRRVWRHTALRPAAFLSVEPDNDTVIDGVVASVPSGDWAALDKREVAYLRHDVSHQIAQDGPSVATAVYAVDPAHLSPPDIAHPILLSYLDVVVQGFARVHGPEGVARFFETTDGWQAPVMDDRSAPIYPRHQRLDGAERALVDDWIDRLGIEIRR